MGFLIGSYHGCIIVCVEEFFVFKKGSRYYCTREGDDYFYVHNNTGKFGVHEIKISSKLKSCFNKLRN